MTSPHLHRRNYNIAGHAHELTFGCYQHFEFFKSDRTCSWLSESIDAARVELDFELWAYVFMPTHVHLIVRPLRPDYDIAEIRYAIKHPTSKKALAWLRENHVEWIPRLTRRRGSRTETLFWQSGGGYDRNITSTRALLEMIDYVHLNPVRKGFVDGIEQWKWSSAGQFLGHANSMLRIDSIPAEWVEV